MVMTTKNCFSAVSTIILRDRTEPLLIEGAPVEKPKAPLAKMPKLIFPRGKR